MIGMKRITFGHLIVSDERFEYFETHMAGQFGQNSELVFEFCSSHRRIAVHKCSITPWGVCEKHIVSVQSGSLASPGAAAPTTRDAALGELPSASGKAI